MNTVLNKTNKLTFLLLCFCLGVTGLQAQTVEANSAEAYEYKAGQFEINAGIGLMSTYVSGATTTKVPPLSVVLNYRIKKNISVGAYFGYSSTGYQSEEVKKGSIEETLYLTNDFYLAGLRLQGHYNSGRADFYGGAMLGYNFSKIDTNIEDQSQRPGNVNIQEKSLVTYSGFIGMKYLVTKHIGLYGEIGYGASLVNLGASYRF